MADIIKIVIKGSRGHFILLPRDRFVPLFKEIKSMVPKCEYTPAVLMTSEDCEKEE